MLALCATLFPSGAPTGRPTIEYPHEGDNALEAGGGGPCTYSYTRLVDGHPVVTEASCSITRNDLDQVRISVFTCAFPHNR